MVGKKNNVVSIAEIHTKKLVKEKELEFYREHLLDCERRMSYVQMDIKVTLEIIDMLEKEKLVLVDASVHIINIDTEDTPEEGNDF